MNKIIIIAITTGVLCLLFPLSAFAAGFAILQQGTAPMAQGNAFVAQADDPSAIFFNPAGINQLKGTQVYLGATAIAPRAEYKGLGTKSRTESHVYLPLQFYLTHELTTDLAVGLGVFSPFGLGTKWDDGWAGRYVATSSDLNTFSVNPVLSWKASEKLSVAGGVNVMRAEADLRKKLDLSRFGLPDGNQLFKGADYGYGYNLGLLYQLTPATNIGLSYRSEVKVKIDGDAEYSVDPKVAAFFPNGGAHSQFVFPPSLFAGVAYKGLAPWVFECDLTWTGWSTFEELRVTLDRPVSSPPKSVSVQPRNWNDVFAYRFGVNYKWDEAITIRAGYIFDESPVPDETMDPSIPDADRHIFCLGGDYRLKDFTIGIAYNYVLGKKRDKHNTIGADIVPGDNRANGEYQQTSHSLAVSISYSF
ncbi:MAG: outer membrane protein transport protein [Deltaproteobacteria bacterium]|nr:outer membrane protein transport protein [Deltaproteobacteria bacterium]